MEQTVVVEFAAENVSQEFGSARFTTEKNQ